MLDPRLWTIAAGAAGAAAICSSCRDFPVPLVLIETLDLMEGTALGGGPAAATAVLGEASGGRLANVNRLARVVVLFDVLFMDDQKNTVFTSDL